MIFANLFFLDLLKFLDYITYVGNKIAQFGCCDVACLLRFTRLEENLTNEKVPEQT